MAKRYGLLIDLDRCTGCQTCNVACKMENSLDRVSGIRVETVGGPRLDTPSGEYPNLSMYYLPVPCMHCNEPPCMPSCPTEAIYQRQDGIVLIDDEKCNGCQQCLEACPYDVLAYDPERDKVWKCTIYSSPHGKSQPCSSRKSSVLSGVAVGRLFLQGFASRI